MSMELSKLFGMDIYSIDAEYVGKAYDFVIDLEQGRVSKITLEPFKVSSKKEAVNILKKKSVPYETVVAVKDIILIDPRKKHATQTRTPVQAPRTSYSRLLTRTRRR